MTWRQKPLREQVVLITGATSGIGLATARQAAAQGASVMLVARNEIALRSAVAAIEQIGGLADWAVADVGDPKAVGDAANKAVARFGRIDTWVNNAGVAIFAKLLDTPDAEHRQLFRTNYFGTVNGCRVATSHMRTKGGTLITIGSIASEIPSPMMGAYAASKHAIKGFVDSLRIEVEADKLPIIVTLIKPSGMIRRSCIMQRITSEPKHASHRPFTIPCLLPMPFWMRPNARIGRSPLAAQGNYRRCSVFCSLLSWRGSEEQ